MVGFADAMAGMTMTSPGYIWSDTVTLQFTPVGATPILSVDYHTQTPTLTPVSPQTIEMHYSFSLKNYVVTGWPTAGTNKLYIGLSWTNGFGAKIDGVYCTLAVT